MPSISKNELIKAAIKSTEEYLKFLKDQGRGQEKYEARKKKEFSEEYPIEGTCWFLYEFTLPRRLQIRSDTAAVYVPEENPGDEVRAWIVSYEKGSGTTYIALEKETDSGSGQIIIDFRWIVAMYLAYMKAHLRRGSNGKIR